MKRICHKNVFYITNVNSIQNKTIHMYYFKLGSTCKTQLTIILCHFEKQY